MEPISDTAPKVSVISIALAQQDFDGIKDILSRQSFRDFEFVGEVGGTIPEAWNRAIQRARGEILIFTETDARPLNDTWIEDLINGLEDKSTIVKGLEITETLWDMSNLAGYRELFLNAHFNERFRWAEDTELLCRLKKSGYRMIFLEAAPVVHVEKSRSRRQIRRGFRYGLYWARLRHRYRNHEDVSGFVEIFKALMKAGLNLLGYSIGYLLYMPERRMRD
jgi:hypothetical protein